MSVDANWPQLKYPDEIRDIPINWAPVLGDATIVDPVVVTGVGVVVDNVSQVGAVTLVRVSGGDLQEIEPRIQCLAFISTGERLGYNLGIPLHAR
jgi:hypothetical protein